MAPFIGKAECREKVRFPKCEVNNAMIEIEFKLVETEGNQGADDSGDEEVKDTTPTKSESSNAVSGSTIDTKHFEDEIAALKQQLAQIKRESSDFQLKSQNLEEQVRFKDGQIQSLQTEKDQAVKNLQSMSNSDGDEQQVLIGSLSAEKDQL